MKKLFALISIFTLLIVSAEAQTIRYPFGAATFSDLTVDNDTLYPTVTNSLTYYTLDDTLVGNTVMYATISASVKAGDELFFQSLNGVIARTLTFKSTYFVCPSITTTANKTKVYRFIYNGTKFVYQGATQID